MRVRIGMALMLGAALQVGVSQAADGLDLNFGSAGYLGLGFQAVDGDAQDVGVVACPMPNGDLIAVGFASGGRRIVSAWLTDSGALDSGLGGGDGKESFDIPPGTLASHWGLCGSDGSVTLAFEKFDPVTAEGNIYVYRVDPTTGLPLPSFGGGFVVLDLDSYASGLGTLESPASLNVGANGAVLVSGQYDDAAGILAGFVALIDASGAIHGPFLSSGEDFAIRDLLAAGPAADGTLWALAHRDPQRGGQDGALIRLRPDGNGGIDYVDMPHPRIGAGVVPVSGRMIDDRTLMLVGTRGATHPAAPSHAIVARVTAAMNETLVLAPPESGELRLNSIAPAEHGRVYVSGFVRNPSSPPQHPLVFARLRSRGALTLDASFGLGGVQSVARANLDACNEPQIGGTKRVTLWKGQLTAIGLVDRDCDPTQTDNDYLVMRMLPPMHGDGFE